MLKSYRKNILREMKGNLSRMVSLFGIAALGVMMLTGLMCIAPDMRSAGQEYYVQQNVFDLRVLSTLGLTEQDIAAIAAVDGVEAVQPVKYQDVEAHWQGREDTIVVRLQQLPTRRRIPRKTWTALCCAADGCRRQTMSAWCMSWATRTRWSWARC